jgi:hypothetical protein
MPAWLNIAERKFDFLWVAISIGLAIFTWLNAVREAHAPIWLYVLLHIQAAAIFATRRVSKASSNVR